MDNHPRGNARFRRGAAKLKVDGLWSVADVAEYLNVPSKTLYTWRYQGKGPPAFRLGKHLRFKREEVEDWLAGDIVKSCGTRSVNHAASFLFERSTNVPFTNFAPARTSATR